LSTTAHTRADVDDCALWQPAAEFIREQINARRVILWLRTENSEARRVLAGEPLPGEVSSVTLESMGRDLLLRDAREDGLHHHHFAAASFAVQDALASRDADEALVMALHGGDGLVGVLEAHDHRSPWRGFGVSDKHTVLTLAHELGNAIANRQLEDRLRHDASHDPVTGLLNRPGFEAAARDLLTEGAFLLRVEIDVHAAAGGIVPPDWTDIVVSTAAARITHLLDPGFVLGT
jgi:GAF domain-containing protein